MSLEQFIVDQLQTQLSPTYLEVVNESHGHRVPANSETHFKVVIAAECFVGQTLVKRHRSVYDALTDALAKGVHALALHTYTPEEWLKRASAPQSPNCMGGGKA
jgi:BolA family transcriptional regulator, general stress-responsive regulator